MAALVTDDMLRMYWMHAFPIVDIAETQFVGKLSRHVFSADLKRHFAAATPDDVRRALSGTGSGGGLPAHRFDTGPICKFDYSIIIERRNVNNDITAMPSKEDTLGREFVVDVDNTDYTEYRTLCGCGSDKDKMCNRCWGILVAGVHLTVTRLSRRFGFACLPVFSGGRGFHIRLHFPRRIATWCPETMADSLRKCVIERLAEIPEGGDGLPEHGIQGMPPVTVPVVDIPASTAVRRLIRCPFSPHAGRPEHRIATPLQWDAMRGLPADESASFDTFIRNRIPSVAELYDPDLEVRKHASRKFQAGVEAMREHYRDAAAETV